MANPEAIRKRILELVEEYCREKFGKKGFDPTRDIVHYARRVFDSREMTRLVDTGLDSFLAAHRYAECFESYMPNILACPLP